MTTPALFDLPGPSRLDAFYEAVSDSCRRHIAAGNDPTGHHARQLARALARDMTADIEPGGSQA